MDQEDLKSYEVFFKNILNTKVLLFFYFKLRMVDIEKYHRYFFKNN